MICKFCGMDSATTDVCSWCGKSLVSSPSEPPAAPTAEPATTVEPTDSNQPTTVVPLAEGGEAANKAVGTRKMAPGMVIPSAGRARMPAPAAPIPASRDAHYVPPTPAAKSGVPSDLTQPSLAQPVAPLAADLTATPTPTLMEQAQILGATEAKPADIPPKRQFAPGDTIMGANTPLPTSKPAPTPEKPTISEAQKKAASQGTTEAKMAEEGYDSPHAELIKYLGVFAILLIVTGLLCYIKPDLYALPMTIAMFVGTLLLPVMRVTPWADEDGEDLVWFILFTLLFGPLVGAVIYLVMFLLRQGGNPSVLGGMLVTALVRIVAEVASHGMGIVPQLLQMSSPFTSISHLDASLIKTLLLNWAGFVSIAGWQAATLFHKADE